MLGKYLLAGATVAAFVFAAQQPALAQESLSKRLGSLFSSPAEDELVEPDLAFKLALSVTGPDRIRAVLTPAKGYYMYKSRIHFSLKDANGVAIKSVSLPAGVSKKDPIFGTTEVYTQPATADILLTRPAGARKIGLVASYQGCHEKTGVCYPPIEKTHTLSLP